MARIVCQVLHRTDRITFLWSEGAAAFEPYHLEGAERANLLDIACKIHAKLGVADDAELTPLGQQLHGAMFPPSAAAVQTWFAELARDNKVEKLEILSDAPGLIPWNLVCAGDGRQSCWGVRFNLGVGRRVNALRQNLAIVAPVQMLAADLDLIEQLTPEQKPLLNAGPLLHSREALAEELKKQAPDLLLLLVRFEQGQLRLGADELDAAELQTWIEEARDGNPDPIVILMGCGNPTEQMAWQALLGSATAALSGIVANETLLPAAKAFGVGHAFAQRFMPGPASVGEVLRTLRSEGSAALAFSAFCPPHVHVGPDGTLAERDVDLVVGAAPLPRLPYRPFAAYDAADRPLFLGRDADTLHGALLVDRAETRGIFLHGSPAVGKTSYLQAGLIPCLEQESVGYRILRDRSPLDAPVAESDYPILILRSTADLAGQFADALSVFCAQPYIHTTPAGTQAVVDLPGILQRALLGKSNAPEPSTAIQPSSEATGVASGSDDADTEDDAGSARELWIAMRDNRDFLAKVLDEITRALPFELVIVVDQGEELLTLVHTPQEGVRRQKALDMLLRLSQVAARCKIVFTLRSQFLGQLISLLPEGRTPADWGAFHLRPLSEAEMVEALLAPTSREEIPYSDQVPHEKYRFSFEASLAQQIVAEAIDAAADAQQSPLALIQATGALLYDQQVLVKKQETLHAGSLKDCGGVKNALMKHLDASLQRLTIGKLSQQALRQLIGKLYTSHADGTVSRDLIPAGELKNFWHGSTEPVEPVVNRAAEEQGLFEIQQLLVGGQPEVYVSLPQDSLAQLGKKIDGEKEVRAFGRTRVIDTLWIMIPFAFLCASISFYVTKNYLGGTTEVEARDEFRKSVIKEARELVEAQVKDQIARSTRQPLYYGLVAQADQALRADNALRAHQILWSQPAARRAIENNPKNPLPELRGFEWYYLLKQLNSERHLFEGHRSVINGVAISPDGKLAASCSATAEAIKDDGAIRIWDLTTGNLLARAGVPKTAVHAVAFSPDGKLLASAGADKTVRLWDVSNLKTDVLSPSKSLTGHTDAVHAVAFGKDSQTLASGGADNTVIVWDVANDKPKNTLTKEHTGAVRALAFTDDGRTLVSAGADAQLVFWDADAGKKRQAVKTPYQSIATLAISPDGKTVGTGGVETKLDAELGMIRFWNVADGKEMHTPIHHSAGVLSLAFAPDGKSIVSGGRDHLIRQWDIVSGKEQRKWIGHLGAVSALAYAKDGATIVSGSHDAKVKAWDPARSPGPEVIRAHADWVQCLALNPKNTLLASGARDGTVKLWNPADGKMVLEVAKAPGAVTSLAFSHHKEKTYLAVATRDDKNAGEIQVWNVNVDAKQGVTAKLHHTLKEHTKGVTSLAFYPAADKADLLISGSADQTVKLWDADKGKEKETYRGHKDEVRCVAFNPNGSGFVSGGKDQRVCLYDLDHKEFTTLAELHLAAIESIVFFNLGERAYLTTASADQTVRIWLVDKKEGAQPDPRQIRFFRAHVQSVSHVLFSDKGIGLIASAGWDGAIKLYDLEHERFTLLGHVGAVRALALAADQSFLVSAGNDGTIRFWRARRKNAGQSRARSKRSSDPPFANASGSDGLFRGNRCKQLANQRRLLIA